MPSDWLVMQVPSDSLYQKPKSVCLFPRGARFECYESAVRFAATSNPSVSFVTAKTSLGVDASTVTLPDLTLTTASYFDDWQHRGTDHVLSSLPWYVYSMWVYMTERMSPQDVRAGLYLDVDFAPHYKLAVGYVQRTSLLLRVPQPEGMTLPTSIQDPNANAMYTSLLFRPFHAAPMIKATGETPDPFLCLHAAEDAEENTHT